MARELITNLGEAGVRYEASPVEALEILSRMVAAALMYWQEDSEKALELFAILLKDEFASMRRKRRRVRKPTNAIH
jgi:hypothetical protein